MSKLQPTASRRRPLESLGYMGAIEDVDGVTNELFIGERLDFFRG